jgi:hypothetical protein
MNLAGKIAERATVIIGDIYSILPFPGISNPIFIIGCGRSGTTILGKSLSKHRRITYLNEPRHLWLSVFPETDIWTSKAYSRNGKLFLTEADVDFNKGKKLSRLFRFKTIVNLRPVLVEKLPINNFRLDFIQQIFPDARFIHIYRNGLEVARSIQKISEKGGWFGSNIYKWDKLVDYAKNSDDTKKLPELCDTYYDKGLLEWRLSTEAVVGFLRRLPDDAFLETSYDKFIDDPVETISKILSFIGVDCNPNVETFVSDTVARKSSRLDSETISEKEQIIGGNLLPLSADGGKGLTNKCQMSEHRLPQNVKTQVT